MHWDVETVDYHINVLGCYFDLFVVKQFKLLCKIGTNPSLKHKEAQLSQHDFPCEQNEVVLDNFFGFCQLL